MLNGFSRVAPWACAWMLGLPNAHAVEDAQGKPVPFEHYQGWRDEPLQDWRAANERVGATGGWRTYLQESEPDADGTNDADGTDHGGHDDHSHPGQ